MTVPVPLEPHKEINARMSEKEERRLREEYSRLLPFADPAQLWLFDRLVDRYAEDLYNIQGPAKVTADGKIVPDPDRDDSGKFI